MADEGNAAEVGPEPSKSKLVPLIVIGALMLVEGVGVFALTKMFAPAPPEVLAGEAGEDAVQAEGMLVADDNSELVLATCRPSNKNGAKALTVSIKVSAVVQADLLEKMQERVTNMQDRINDRVNYVVRSADQRHLNEPGLETIKRQLKREMDILFGDDELIIDILIPELLQSG